MKLTRRGFLKGAVASAGAAVAGVRLKWPDPDTKAEAEIVTDIIAEQVVEEYLAEAHVPTSHIHGREFDDGIVLNGRHFNGNYSISYHRDHIDTWTWDDSFTKFLGGLPSSTASLGLLVDHGVELPWGGDECELILPCHVRCKARVDSISFSPMQDSHWVDMELTCWDVVHTGGYDEY